MKTILSTLIFAAFSAAAANADVVTITFDQANQSANPGATLQFFGTITNNTPNTVYLNSDDLTIGGPPDLASNDLFFANVPISLAPNGQLGASSGDIELFDVIVSNPLSNPLTTYPGTYDILGGSDPGSAEVLSSTNFSVTTAPEPAVNYLIFGMASAALILISGLVRGRSSKRVA
jgi:hypothetical protein